MDDRAIRERKENQIDACPNCARIRSLKSAERNSGMRSFSIDPAVTQIPKLQKFASERFVTGTDATVRSSAVYSPEHQHNYHNPFSSSSSNKSSKRRGNNGGRSPVQLGPPEPPPGIPSASSFEANNSYFRGDSPATSAISPSPSLGSPVTRSILGRQSHTRHVSIDVGGNPSLLGGAMPKTYGSAQVRVRTYSEEYQTPVGFKPVENRNTRGLRRIQSGASLTNESSGYSEDDEEEEEEYDDESSVCSSAESSVEEIWDTTKSKIQLAKYIFLTLRLALFNSMVIIAVGCVGFWLIEGFTLIDGWYFTTVLLTTVG